MIVWYDACTGKHIRYGVAIAERLRKNGYKVIITTREHPDTLPLASKLHENPIVIGKYYPESLISRLRESTKRQLDFLELFKDQLPDVAVSSQSVELGRVAFGLGIPTILTADTPYAEAVNRLTIPLADTLVVSKAIPSRAIKNYGAKKIVQFDGVDEVAWIQGFEPSEKFDLARPLIVVRQMEKKAAYASGREDITVELAKKLKKFGNVLLLPRYGRESKEELLTMGRFVDTAELVSNADIVIGVGGTIGREAALQGVPSVVVSTNRRELRGRTYVNEYLSKRGFPLFMVPADKILFTVKKNLGKKWNVKDKLAKLENPVSVIEKIVVEKAKT